tara:strand:+ start:4527 stop:5192 length:666 start_codon:yes stop_codon:yes gene_type:complete
MPVRRKTKPKQKQKQKQSQRQVVNINLGKVKRVRRGVPRQSARPATSRVLNPFADMVAPQYINPIVVPPMFGQPIKTQPNQLVFGVNNQPDIYRNTTQASRPSGQLLRGGNPISVEEKSAERRASVARLERAFGDLAPQREPVGLKPRSRQAAMESVAESPFARRGFVVGESGAAEIPPPPELRRGDATSSLGSNFPTPLNEPYMSRGLSNVSTSTADPFM